MYPRAQKAVYGFRYVLPKNQIAAAVKSFRLLEPGKRDLK